MSVLCNQLIAPGLQSPGETPAKQGLDLVDVPTKGLPASPKQEGPMEAPCQGQREEGRGLRLGRYLVTEPGPESRTRFPALIDSLPPPQGEAHRLSS